MKLTKINWNEAAVSHLRLQPGIYKGKTEKINRKTSRMKVLVERNTDEILCIPFDFTHLIPSKPLWSLA